MDFFNSSYLNCNAYGEQQAEINSILNSLKKPQRSFRFSFTDVEITRLTWTAKQSEFLRIQVRASRQTKGLEGG